LQARTSPLGREEAAALAGALRAVAEPSRLQLLSLLRSSPRGEACVCELVGALRLSQPTVSHHLKVLTEAGLVARSRRGPWAYYRVVVDQLDMLAAALAAPADDAYPQTERASSSG